MPPFRRRYARKRRPALPRPSMRRKYARRPRLGRRKYGGLRGTRYTTSAAGFTNSLWSWGQRNRLPRQVLAMKRVGAPDIKQFNAGSLFRTLEGYQDYTSFPLCTQETLAEIAAVAGSQASPNRVIIENIIADMTFSNTTNTIAELEIYDCVLKRDLPDNGSWNIGGNVYSASGADPVQWIQEGCNAASTQAPGAAYHRVIGSSIYDSQFFTSFFKIVKRQHVMLQSGATHRHQCMLKVNKLITQAVASQSNAAGLRGFSHYVIVCGRGASGVVTTALPYPAVPNTSTAAPIEMAIVSNQRIKYTFVQDVNSSVTLDDNLIHGSEVVAVRNPNSGVLDNVVPLLASTDTGPLAP